MRCVSLKLAGAGLLVWPETGLAKRAGFLLALVYELFQACFVVS
jgi:hypothetical protein